MSELNYEVDVEEIPGSGARVAARLCNFAEGGAGLLMEHLKWLRTKVAPILHSQKNSWVILYGFASRKGGEDSNQLLSENRCRTVKEEVSQYADQINFKVSQGLGEIGYGNDKNDNWGYFRRAEIYVFAAPPPPGFKPPPRRKPGSVKAPAGCWLITGVDSFGIPIKVGISGGTVAVTLLNDKGEVYVINGVGMGVGVGPEMAPIEWLKKSNKILAYLGEIGLKAGDLQNISDEIKKLNLAGSSETSGAVFKRTVWRANLTIQEITASGYFTIVNGEIQALLPGGEVGFIDFGSPESPSTINIPRGVPWGYYQSLGVGNLKVAVGAGATIYKTTKVEKK
ncbi:MAG: hypothetical protein HC846_11575 [Blastocatellia bacterium]|nr:hypothetical protein [Blastocatellia bacterium]